VTSLMAHVSSLEPLEMVYTAIDAIDIGTFQREDASLSSVIQHLLSGTKPTTLVHYYNCTPHESTGYSPYRLMFGREPKLPVDIMFGIESEGPEQTYTQYVKDLREEMEYASQLAKLRMEEMARKNKGEYDRRQRGSPLSVGDHVLVRKVGLKGRHKLADKWEEHPYVVIEQPNTDIPVFKVRHIDGHSTKVLHRNMLLPLGEKTTTTVHTTDALTELDRRPKTGRKRGQCHPSVVADTESSNSSDEEYCWYIPKADTQMEPNQPITELPDLPPPTLSFHGSEPTHDDDQETITTTGVDERGVNSSDDVEQEIYDIQELVADHPSSGSEIVDSAENDNQSTNQTREFQPEILPRRSQRIRRRPAWMDSGDW
ncbi:hypothetical protein ScPMuIL_015056, partial [Solemya velum]